MNKQKFKTNLTRKTKEEAFKEINDTQELYVDELIANLRNPKNDCLKTINFTSPTGTGKTNMMALLCNKMPECFFVVTTLSKGQLNHQIESNLQRLAKQGNFMVYGLCDYKSNSKLTAADIIRRLPEGKNIIWLRDEGHINTNKWQEVLSDRCFKVVNFSATNKGDNGIKCNFTNTDMLRTVHQQIGTPEQALDKLLEVKEQHKRVKGYNPCAIMRCLDRGIEDRVIAACEERGLKWINITEESFDMSDLCRDDNEYDVILNKFKIVEGIDIRRAHVLYMTNEPANAATTIQVIGRCRRNALLYRSDIDIFAPENDELHSNTTSCWVYYNVDSMHIDSDENGELCAAFCDKVSCEELKSNSVIKVKDGVMSNGLTVLELRGETGTYRVEVDSETGFNVIKPEGEFYKDELVRAEFGKPKALLHDSHDYKLWWAYVKDIEKLTVNKSVYRYNWYHGREIERQLDEDGWYYELGQKKKFARKIVISPAVNKHYSFSDDVKKELIERWRDVCNIGDMKSDYILFPYLSYYLNEEMIDCLAEMVNSTEIAKYVFQRLFHTGMVKRNERAEWQNDPQRIASYVKAMTNGIRMPGNTNSLTRAWNSFMTFLDRGLNYTKQEVSRYPTELPLHEIKIEGEDCPGICERRERYKKAYEREKSSHAYAINIKVTYNTTYKNWHETELSGNVLVSDIKKILDAAPSFLPYNAMLNDRHSAIVGTDLMKQVKDNDTKATFWSEDRSVTSKVSKYSKFQRFIQGEYSKEIEQASKKAFNGKNAFAFDSKCNSCLGYCVEYYSKYLVYGKNYLGHFIDDAMAESKCKEANDNIIVRACMLKYKENMMAAYGAGVSKLIRTINAQQLIQDKYKEFVKTVVGLGKKAARFVSSNMETHEIDKEHPLHSPVLSVRHIAGLADYIDESTIIDIKCTNSITKAHLRQVLAYHYLSTKRDDLHINKAIVYDAVSGKSVKIDLSKHECHYALPKFDGIA